MADLKRGLETLASTVARSTQTPVWSEWGTVADPAPLVTLDSDAEQTPRPVAANAAGPVRTGDRVLILHEGPRLTLVAAPAPHIRSAPFRVVYPIPAGTWTAWGVRSFTVPYGRQLTAIPGISIEMAGAPAGSAQLTARFASPETITHTSVEVQIWNVYASGRTIAADGVLSLILTITPMEV